VSGRHWSGGECYRCAGEGRGEVRRIGIFDVRFSCQRSNDRLNQGQ
jgi:hypothetical protein